jgi:hypothetical protein
MCLFPGADEELFIEFQEDFDFAPVFIRSVSNRKW